VNEITTDPARIGWLQQNGSPVVESMEGGALHYVCLQEGLPFLQLRSVSNDVGIRDKTKWNIPLAIGELNKKLTGLLNELAGQEITILEKVSTIFEK
jgi:futalosine hydrolase